MPLKIIRQDITKIVCDAIVNPTNTELLPSGGADLALHRAAGKELLDDCRKIGSLSVGEAIITPAYRLPSKFVIHTVGPVWQGGLFGERVLLRSCYYEALRLAALHGCASIAFPLIASGAHGYPKDRVLKVATEVITEFLREHEMKVYILVYDKEAYEISEGLFREVGEYISKNLGTRDLYPLPSPRSAAYLECDSWAFAESEPCGICESREAISSSPPTPRRLASYSSSSDELQNMLKNMDRSFAETLFHFIDERGISDVECYKRSNVDKKTFSKIKCKPDYRPSKVTAVSFAIGLRLNLEQTAELLASAGMCLSRSFVFDTVIEYFITSGNYETVFDVNEVLYKLDQPLLGV